MIGQMSVYYNDPNLVNTRQTKLQGVSRDDIQRVAKKYLTPDNRTVITTLVKAKDAPKPAAGQ
jgi:predicted Zn-dependent peptidase